MNWKKIAKTAATIIVSLVILFFIIKLGGFFGAEIRDVQRNIFRSSQSFIRGAETQLADYRLQYLRASSKEEKEAILITVRMQFADVDPDKLNPELASFLRKALND